MLEKLQYWRLSKRLLFGLISDFTFDGEFCLGQHPDGCGVHWRSGWKRLVTFVGTI
jgi:hypothetical protein